MKGVRVLALFVIAMGVGAQNKLPKFMGREVTMHEPEHDAEGFPKGSATICLEGPPLRQCYTAPEEFGNIPNVEVVQLRKDLPALFFSASSGGVSGWDAHFALLVPAAGMELQDLLLSQVSLSNQGQNAFWSEPGVSDAQLFLTADAVLGAGEMHYATHRYMVSVYVRSSVDSNYWLADRYMTVRKYTLGPKTEVLASERPEILARLKRVVAARKPN